MDVSSAGWRAIDRSPLEKTVSGALAMPCHVYASRRAHAWIRLTLIAACIAMACMIAGVMPRAAYADHVALQASAVSYTKAEVMGMIDELSEDPRDFTAADTEKVLAIVEAFGSLSADDQAALDNGTAKGKSQSYGRTIESAQWAVLSLSQPDNATTLPDGSYDASTEPALSSSYSKGKSTSSRERPWSVKSIQVRGGKAYATVTVQSSTYPSMITGGVEYPNTAPSGANCTFEDVPIAPNGTFYLAGVSSSMPRPIMFSVTTSIEEPAPITDGTFELQVTNNAGSFAVTSATLEVEGSSRVLKVSVEGDEYRALYPGAYSDALANAGKETAWIFGAEEDGAYSFEIPVEPGASVIPFTTQANSLVGKGAQACFHPGRFRIDASATTLTVEPYDGTIALEVADSTQAIGAGSSASARIVGGQEPNDVTVALDLPMSSDTFTRVMYPSVISGAVSNAEARLGEGNVLQLVLVNAGDVSSFSTGQPLTVQFYLDFADTWVSCEATLDLVAKKFSLTGGKLDIQTVMKMIAALPQDPLDVTDKWRGPIGMAESAFEALSADDQATIDKTAYGMYKYGRLLESCVWALRSLDPVDNSTTLPDGVYTGKVASGCSLGKSESARGFKFTVKKVTVSGGKATALLEHDSTSPDYLSLGGKIYRHVNTDESAKSQFEVPIDLNSTMYVTQMRKNPTENTVGTVYELTSSVDESATQPDQNESENGDNGNKESGDNGDNGNKGNNDNGDDGKKDGANEKDDNGKNNGNNGDNDKKDDNGSKNDDNNGDKNKGDNENNNNGNNNGNENNENGNGNNNGNNNSNNNSNESGSNTSTTPQSSGTTNNASILARVSGSTGSTGSGTTSANKTTGSASSSNSNSSTKTNAATTASRATTANVRGAANAPGATVGSFDGSDEFGDGSSGASPVVLSIGLLLLLVMGGFGFTLGFTRKEYGRKMPWSWK